MLKGKSKATVQRRQFVRAMAILDTGLHENGEYRAEKVLGTDHTSAPKLMRIEFT